jgi:hypothetical protein
VAITVEGSTRAPRERTFDVIVPILLSDIFTGYGPLPAVVGTRDQSGAWDHVGATRTVELADGSEAREEITSYDRGSHFGYRVSAFTGPAHFLVAHADGAWWFTDAEGGGTHIRWTYTFQPRPARGTIVGVTLGPLWSRYASRALALAIKQCER